MPKQLRDEHNKEDEPSDGNKPLKKARYVWEVKGKHHLKETYKTTQINNNNNNNEVDFTLNNNRNKASKESAKSGERSEEPPHTKCCNSCCIQKILEEADGLEADAPPDRVPLTLVEPSPKNEEYYLRKWQARQIARGYVDNTINCVLDTLSSRPTDADDMVDNYENDGRVEDDAILMAIQSHGLQSSARLEEPFGSNSREEGKPSTRGNLENFENERKEREITNGERSEVETMDFLSAAVSVAIQKKGLSYGY
ncbi:unnamed protein product [Phyllotreta striolata]|uniref:Uncharacterized protein n=1 Tax=Phyllotreta striolata TaxID=444603 RepID=A0A9N9U0Z9_PHYSR|nr:unnamed protein product [Phyllotreta striolata]